MKRDIPAALSPLSLLLLEDRWYVFFAGVMPSSLPHISMLEYWGKIFWQSKSMGPFSQVSEILS
jgi:hypothetical protein